MNTWYKWIVPMLLVCAIQINMVQAAEQTLAPTKGKQIAEELSGALDELAAGVQATTDERTQRIALLVARIIQLSPWHSPAILAGFSRELTPTDLSIVSAAAVMTAGTGSPAMLQAMVDAQGEDASRTQAVHQGAIYPTQVLGTQVAAMMQPIDLLPTPVEPPVVVASLPSPVLPAATPRTAPTPAPQPVTVATPSPEPVVVAAVASPPVEIETLVRSAPPAIEEEPALPVPPVVAAAPQPPPPQPPGLPPRPPALPYRGQ